MAKPAKQSARERILRLADKPQFRGEPRAVGTPLDWDDIGFLCHGLAFAGGPFRLATQPVTERHNLGPRGAWILNLLEIGIAFPHELSEMFRIGRSLVSVELSRLSDAGLISSHQDKDDGRLSRLSLTAEGREALMEVRAELERIIRHSLTGYSAEDIRLCAQMLSDLRNSTLLME